MNLTPKGQLYVVVVSAAGLLVVGHCITVLLARPLDWEWVVLAGLTLLSGSFTVRVPSFQARISVSETFVFTSVLLFGTCAGTITVALDTLVAALSSQRRAREPLRVLFNLSSASLSIWAASHLFYLVSGIEPLSVAPTRVPELLWPLVMMTAVHFLLNSGLVAIALATERNESGFTIWRRIFPWLSLNYFGGASVAALLVSYTRSVDFAALSIIVPLLVISYLTYKMALGRVEDAVLHVEQVNKLYLSTIETLATAIDAKDQVTHGHIRRVQRFALGLATKIGIRDPLHLQALEAAALLHDMGKIAVPEHILNKPSRLTAGEFEKMKLHASIGADILSSISFPYPVVPIVRHHHENWNGTGYPDGLRGTSIPLGARILAVVDCFDALTSDRPYRPRLSDSEAVAILMERRGVMYDPLVVDMFIACKDELAESLVAELSTHNVRAADNVEGLVKQPVATHTKSHAGGTSTRPIPHLELHHAVRTVLMAIERELKTDVSILLLKDAARDELVAFDALGNHADQISGMSISLGTRISGWVAANARPIINSDARLELATELLQSSDSICAAIPIRSGSDVIGVLIAVRHATSPFSQTDIAFLERIAGKFDDPPLSELLQRAADLKGPSPGKRTSVVH
jgi:putative nucleotidyltransferase with HDIG domain